MVIERLPAVSPLGIKVNKAGQRFLANVLPCVGVLGETLVDLGLAVDSLKEFWDPFGLAAVVLATIAIPTSIFVLYSSRKPFSPWSLRNGGIIIVFVILVD